MKNFQAFFSFVFLILFFIVGFVLAEKPPLSAQTEECLSCHSEVHPGIVAQWQQSRHALVSAQQALKKAKLQRRVSSTAIPDSLKKTAVGCYECHGINPEQHKDTFPHNGFRIHIVVTPKDCAVCHSKEVKEYAGNLMAHAYNNLMKNTLYQQLVYSINGKTGRKNGVLHFAEPTKKTNADACLYCHGTRVEVSGNVTKETAFGKMDFPILEGWPNQGVGRLNPDGSMGSCTSCHSRHDFSIAMARNPAACAECHKGPDVPAYKVYKASKHGNIYAAQHAEWNFKAVPWTVGKDFTAPACAACHVSLIVNSDSAVVAERTHRFNDRLSWRLFGAPYAHAHPQSADLSIIRNQAGLPLATELNGDPVKKFLITRQQREARMKAICLTCHSSNWVDNHFARLKNTIKETNETTRLATEIMQHIWQAGLADNTNLFDEAIEREWTSLWLFYTNSTRFSWAMGGGGDYGVFANGRFQASQNLIRLNDWLKRHLPLKQKR